jgi:hypothetical protein
MAGPSKMSKKSKNEYIEKMNERYQSRGRAGRSLLLDEICEVCGYDRKHAIKLMRPGGYRRGVAAKKAGRKATYGAEELAVIKPIWLAANQPCGKLLKGLLPLWLPHVAPPPADDLRGKVLAASASTLDRLLKPVKAVERRRRNSATKPGTLIKSQIPIRTDNDDIDRPGYVEADTVAHCGGSLEGDFVWSVNLTDIDSQWTQCRAVWNKGQHGVVGAIRGIEADLPFELLGFDSDNGSEFLNWHLVKYLQDRGESPKVAFTRSRPYRKNDNARVEGKNWTHARQLLGYDRLGNPDCLAALNEAYRAWCLMKNLYVPVMKLTGKIRVGGKYRKKYDKPKTPADRLLAWPGLPSVHREWIEQQLSTNDPFALSAKVEEKLTEVFALCRTGPEDSAWTGTSAGLEGSAPSLVATAPSSCASPSSPAGQAPATASPVSPIMSQRIPIPEPAPV